MLGTEQCLSVLFDSQVIWCQVQVNVLFKRLLYCLLSKVKQFQVKNGRIPSEKLKNTIV